MSKFKKRFVIVIIFIIVLTSCREKKIAFGFISGLSGGNADLGESARNGAIIAIEEINDAGGINGIPVSLSIKDDGNDYQKAVSAAKSFVSEKVKIIIGPLTTTMTEAVMTVTESAEMLLFTPTASAIQLSGKDDNLLRLNSTTRDNAFAYADHMYTRRIYRRIQVVADEVNGSFTESWYTQFIQRFYPLGGEVLGLHVFNSQTLSSYSDLVSSVLEENPDCILFIANAVDTARLAQQIRKVNSEVPFLAVEWAGTNQLIELGGTAVQGTEVLQNVNLFGNEERFLKFVDDYIKRFSDKPSYSSIMTYEAFIITAEAYRLKDKSQSLKEAIILYSPYKGLQQEIAFDRYGDSRRIPVFVKVNNREYIPIE